MISKEAHRASSRLQQNTIDHQLYELERTCWGCHVARIEYVVAGESELCSIGIIFLLVSAYCVDFALIQWGL